MKYMKVYIRNSEYLKNVMILEKRVCKSDKALFLILLQL